MKPSINLHGTDRFDDASLDRLAYELAENRIEANNETLIAVARQISTVAPTLAIVLADRAAPAVARSRAFGLAAALINDPPDHSAYRLTA